jgi:hypothetical protein
MREETPVIHRALAGWLHYNPLLAIATLLVYPEVSLSERLLTLAALTGLGAVLGLWQQ